jgi:hypothetical protein
VPADPGEPEVLQDVQELGLERERQLADLVQIDRPGVGEFELARLAAVGAGERASLMTEKLGLEQLLRDCSAVDLDERPLPARGGRVHRARDQVLADAALAADQDGRIRVRDTFNHRADLPHPGMAVEERRFRCRRHRLDSLSLHCFLPDGFQRPNRYANKVLG